MTSLRINLIILVLYGTIQSSWTLGKSPRSKGGNKSFRQYNEYCILYDSSASCNSSQGLMCLDSGLKGYRCLCPSNKLHAQLYDTKRSACVGKVLNTCVPDRNSNSRQQALNQSLCVENSECNTAVYGLPVCLCKPGFTEKDDGTCVPSLKYGDSCDNEDDNSSSTTERDGETVVENNSGKKWDEKHGLACVDSKCQCRFPKDQYYDEKEGKCISYAEGRCTHDTHIYSCVPNANCPSPPRRINANGNPPLPPLPPFLSGIGFTHAHAHAIAGERVGDEDEGEHIFVMPFKPPRMPSLPLPPPQHHLPPIHSPFHHSYAHSSSSSHQYPLSKEDPLMDFDSMRFDNMDFARSIFFGSQKTEGEQQGGDSKEDHHPRCECLPGFSRTAAGWCMKSYGNKCHPEDDESVRNNTSGSEIGGARELCNADQFLECMDAHDGGSFTCQCRNQMNERYDPERRECVAMVGRRCRPVGNYPKCDKGSECSINGICECANGTSLTPLETCAKDYEETCEPGECNGWKGLICHGKSRTCLCLDSYLRYDKGKEACVASKGNMCGSVRAAMRWGSSTVTIPETSYVECEQGVECKAQEMGGQKMASRCV